MNSILFPDSERYLDNGGNFMSYGVYQIEPCENNGTLEWFEESRSLCPLAAPWLTNDKLTAVLKGYRVSKVTPAGFERTLEFFGLERSAPGSDVKNEEICSFIAFISSFKIGEKEGFLALLEKCQMNGIYEYDESVSHDTNLRYFEDFVQAMCPLRFFLYDGQHRAVGLKCYSERIGECRETLPEFGNLLPVFNVPDDVAKYKLKSNKQNFDPRITLDKRHVWCHVGFGGSLSLQDQYEVFRNMGAAVTSAENRRVKSNLRDDAIQYFVMLRA
ncbi:hypothetical protein SEMRO_1780_G297050.1 [Seminavis robusta]|uniref:Uncharacterized protein n=1 Tax=Seminavis robusta TaxID=568900 RepID=A0A9N8ESV3_9STRA|nr:hypothetical protein SEMRO_1780_G297050.1 [Seminavis robusta]|eukprot:Sro1780_g297050.1 n/a (273) ;mRNA; r:17422-18240